MECLASNFCVPWFFPWFFPRSFLPVLAWKLRKKHFPGSPKYDAKHWAIIRICWVTLILVGSWHSRKVNDAEFWINFHQLKQLRKAGHWQLPSTILQCYWKIWNTYSILNLWIYFERILTECDYGMYVWICHLMKIVKETCWLFWKIGKSFENWCHHHDRCCNSHKKGYFSVMAILEIVKNTTWKWDLVLLFGYQNISEVF